jgi:hypothetical protein
MDRKGQMIKKIFILILFAIILCATPSWATIFHVTQAGGVGSNPLSAAQFNGLSGNYSNDIFYFSGSFSTRITVNIDGTSGNPVTLDGYEAGVTAPLTDVWASSNGALLNYGMMLYANEYIVVQDFRISQLGNGELGWAPGVGVSGDGVNHFHFQRNYIKNTAAAGLYFGAWDTAYRTHHVIIENNKFVDFQMRVTVGESSAVSLIHLQYVLFRNNIVGHDDPGSTTCPSGCNTLTLHMCDDVLFENNEVYGAPDQTGVAVKELDIAGGDHDRGIYRFNRIHDNDGAGISFGADTGRGTNNMYLYGNLITDNGEIGVFPHRELDTLYIWSNIISTNGDTGIAVWQQAALAPNNISILNNTIAYNGNGTYGPYYTAVNKGGIALYGGSGHTVKNNLFYNNRQAGLGNYWQAYDSQSSTFDFNTLYHSSATATWYYGGAERTLAVMRSSYGMENNGEIAAPGFTNPGGDDYTLTSVGTPGSDLSQCFTQAVDLSGGDAWMETNSGYGRYIEPCLNDALDPNNTDWTTTPPTVAVVDRDTYGWARGAYAYDSGGENIVPTLTSFADILDTTDEDVEVEITLTEMKAQGDEADSDGTVDAFVIKAVSTGTLTIGANSGVAVAFELGVTDTVDVSNNAYWTPAASATGTLNCFTAVAEDNEGAESITPVQASVYVTNIVPTLSTATIGGTGLGLTLVFSEAVSQGAGYADSDLDLDCSTGGDDIALTYVSGDGTATHIYSIAVEVVNGETCNFDFDGSANSIENGDGDDLEAIVSGAVVNSSMVGITPSISTPVKFSKKGAMIKFSNKAVPMKRK